jgi:hypothetical protein
MVRAAIAGALERPRLPEVKVNVPFAASCNSALHKEPEVVPCSGRSAPCRLDDLRAHGAKFHSLTEAIDTATSTGRARWQMIAG